MQASKGKVVAIDSLRQSLLEELESALPEETKEYKCATLMSIFLSGELRSREPA